MNLIKDVWLSDIFLYDVYRLDNLNEAKVVFELPKTKSFIWAKIPTERVDSVDLLNSMNFKVVDVNVTFEINKKYVKKDQTIHSNITEFSKEDETSILKIAESSFVYSRFHLDKNIPNSLADKIKRMWIKNYIDKKRGVRLLVIKYKDEPAGFLAEIESKKENKSVGVIDLISIDKNFQGKGLGKYLVDYWINDCTDKYDILRVGTQIANIPSMRLYESCGFRISNSLYIMHLHLK
ncbi:MAG: GNAT family N-acetyltransferase [Melioribacter sp.]|nr:GNAT family N-acetyltransferase [Melioribacter sp.]